MYAHDCDIDWNSRITVEGATDAYPSINSTVCLTLTIHTVLTDSYALHSMCT